MMYSKELDEFFKKHGIKVMDRIKAVSKGEEFEGELMPKTDAGDSDTIVIKLDSGYNVGIAYASDISIMKIASGSAGISFPKAKTGKIEGLPTISLIYTGGTIGSKVDYKTGGVYMLTKPEELLYEVPELSGIASIDVRNLFGIASEDMSYLEWQSMAKEVAKTLNDGARGAVVTMGTDTMHYASAALSFMLNNLNAPVVFTGAQRSSDRGSSDAFFNLICSTQIAAKSDIAEVGICMHADSSDDSCAFIRGTHVRKMHTSRRDAFRPINDRPLARIKKDLGIVYGSGYRKIENAPKYAVTAETKFEKKVALVKSYPNADPTIIDFYVDKGYKGIILEGTGLGHLPVSTIHDEFQWMPSVKRAMEKGVVVGMTSQCLYGRVNPSVYRNLRIVSGEGVVYCEDMTPETALVKLGWLLGNYKAEEAKSLLNQNIKGEIKSRTLYDEFLI
jgi:glutamyl-tRNA(Gln) amidotransferase subunit D